LLTDILYLSSSRALRVEWKVHEVRNVGFISASPILISEQLAGF
jgi:hypothetical protein